MTSATEHLRALLTEHGVEWEAPKSAMSDMRTIYSVDGWDVQVDESGNGWFDIDMTRYADTPAQAIDATLGRGTCREVKIDHYWRGCGECGYVWEFMYGIGECERPRYCPNCGRRCVG